VSALAAAALALALAPRAAAGEWGRVAITTSIASPDELAGAEVPLPADAKPLPRFPEKLTFDGSWGPVSAGVATLDVDKVVDFNGRPAYHIISEVRTNGFFDTFYPVRDRNEAWLDARTLTSLGYSKKVREGRFFRDEWVVYDRDARTYVLRRTGKDGNFVVKTGTIPAQVEDVLSSLFYVRAQELPDGGSVVVDVNTPNNWPLAVKVLKRERISVPARSGAAVLVQPEMRREGIFVQKGRKLKLWLSDDAEHRPLRMEVEILIGHITVALREML
jgi:hypothetical protein